MTRRYLTVVLCWNGRMAVAGGAARTTSRRFVIEPYIRFKGEPGEQATLFLLDPSGNDRGRLSAAVPRLCAI